METWNDSGIGDSQRRAYIKASSDEDRRLKEWMTSIFILHEISSSGNPVRNRKVVRAMKKQRILRWKHRSVIFSDAFIFKLSSQSTSNLSLLLFSRDPLLLRGMRGQGATNAFDRNDLARSTVDWQELHAGFGWRLRSPLYPCRSRPPVSFSHFIKAPSLTGFEVT